MIKKYMLLILGALLGGIVVIGVIIGIAVIILFPQLTIGNYYTTGKYIQGVNTEWIQGKTIEEISERYAIIEWGKISDGEYADGEYDEWITLQKTKNFVKYSYVPGETGFLGDVLVFLSDGKAKHAEKGSGAPTKEVYHSVRVEDDLDRSTPSFERKWSVEELDSIKRGMTVSEVIEILGKADADSQSDLFINTLCYLAENDRYYCFVFGVEVEDGVISDFEVTGVVTTEHILYLAEDYFKAFD